MKRFAALLPITVLLACSAPGEPAKAEPAVNNQQIVDRYINVIWPATAAFNANHSQGGPGSQQYHAVVDPTNDSAAAYGPLREAVQKLGRQGEYDPQTHTSHGNDGLTLGHVDVQSVQGNTATLDVCYTYTHVWWFPAQPNQQQPGASAMTVQLVNVNNNWYLHSITNDHVMPGCDAA